MFTSKPERRTRFAAIRKFVSRQLKISLFKYFHYKNVNIRFNDNRISKFLREKSNETANAQYWRIKQRDISKTMHFPETLLKEKKKEKLLFFDEEYNVYSTYIGYPQERERGARL